MLWPTHSQTSSRQIEHPGIGPLVDRVGPLYLCSRKPTLVQTRQAHSSCAQGRPTLVQTRQANSSLDKVSPLQSRQGSSSLIYKRQTHSSLDKVGLVQSGQGRISLVQKRQAHSYLFGSMPVTSSSLFNSRYPLSRYSLDSNLGKVSPYLFYVDPVQVKEGPHTFICSQLAHTSQVANRFLGVCLPMQTI